MGRIGAALPLLALFVPSLAFSAPTSLPKATSLSKTTRLAVLSPQIVGEAPAGPRRVLAERFPKGLRASGLTTLTGAAVEGARGATKACGEPCVKRVAQATKTPFVAGARVKADPPYYKGHLWVADGQTGKLVATVNFICNVCPMALLANKMELASSKLAVALRDRAAKPATLIIESDPPGAVIVIDGKAQGTSPARIKVRAGVHVVELRAEGYLPTRRELRAVASVDLPLRVVLLRAPPKKSATRKILAWSAVGAGAAAIIAGVVLLAMDGGGTDCVPTTAEPGTHEFCRREYDNAVPGWILLGTGIAAAGAGTALLLWPRASGSEAARSPRAAARGRISLTPAGLGLRLGATF